MRKRHVYAGGLAALVLTGVALAATVVSGSRAAPRVAAAAIQRTFVSTSGSDANPCTRTSPCRNFQAAIANTLAGGEVVALDSGGYGTFTVDKSLTVAGAPGAHVAVTAFAGTAVAVDAGASDTVVLRNLYLTGLGAERGIEFNAGGSLHVESVVASGFSLLGLAAAGDDLSLFVVDSQFRHNGSFGVYTEGSVSAEIEHTRADANGARGFTFTSGSAATVRRSAATHNGEAGFSITTGSRVAVEDSLADWNGANGVLVSFAAVADLTGDVITNNQFDGIITLEPGTIVRVGSSTVTGNATGLTRGDGTFESYGDNMVRGNTTNTSGTITTVGKT
jgi:hypothetical protein